MQTSNPKDDARNPTSFSHHVYKPPQTPHHPSPAKVLGKRSPLESCSDNKSVAKCHIERPAKMQIPKNLALLKGQWKDKNTETQISSPFLYPPPPKLSKISQKELSKPSVQSHPAPFENNNLHSPSVEELLNQTFDIIYTNPEFNFTPTISQNCSAYSLFREPQTIVPQYVDSQVSTSKHEASLFLNDALDSQGLFSCTQESISSPLISEYTQEESATVSRLINEDHLTPKEATQNDTQSSELHTSIILDDTESPPESPVLFSAIEHNVESPGNPITVNTFYEYKDDEANFIQIEEKLKTLDWKAEIFNEFKYPKDDSKFQETFNWLKWKLTNATGHKRVIGKLNTEITLSPQTTESQKLTDTQSNNLEQLDKTADTDKTDTVILDMDLEVNLEYEAQNIEIETQTQPMTQPFRWVTPPPSPNQEITTQMLDELSQDTPKPFVEDSQPTQLRFKGIKIRKNTKRAQDEETNQPESSLQKIENCIYGLQVALCNGIQPVLILKDKPDKS